MNLRARSHRFHFIFAAALLLVLYAREHAVAQLRPLDPTDFRALRGDQFRVQVGAGVYFKQHASLTGTRGRLVELGDTRVSWRSGRIVIELGGTFQRYFREDSILQPPAAGVHASTPERTRHDAGDYRIQTVLRLTADTARTSVIVRFGTRLPTTDNRVGLERDQTDFFAMLGAARSIGRLQIAGEAGISINGTRLSDFEQSDVMIYAAALEFRGGIVHPFIAVVGQQDFRDWAARGNEDLGELRAGVRLGHRQWLSATFLHGFHDSSPRAGFALSFGKTFR